MGKMKQEGAGMQGRGRPPASDCTALCSPGHVPPAAPGLGTVPRGLFPRGHRTQKKLPGGASEPWGGPQPERGAPTSSYLNSALPVPPGGLVRSVARERDVVFPVSGPESRLSGFGELEKIRFPTQLLRLPFSNFCCNPSPPGPPEAGQGNRKSGLNQDPT